MSYDFFSVMDLNYTKMDVLLLLKIENTPMVKGVIKHVLHNMYMLFCFLMLVCHDKEFISVDSF